MFLTFSIECWVVAEEVIEGEECVAKESKRKPVEGEVKEEGIGRGRDERKKRRETRRDEIRQERMKARMEKEEWTAKK